MVLALEPRGLPTLGFAWFKYKFQKLYKNSKKFSLKLRISVLQGWVIFRNCWLMNSIIPGDQE